MRSRPPFLLVRWIILDVLRLVCIAAAILVAVIALVAAIKPVADGLLQPEHFLKFIGYAATPMLAYALPFAAGFGATLVYHKLALENEATAAYAGGVSHRMLLLPAVVVGIVFAIFLGVLNELVIPGFLQRMQRLITRDLTTWITQEIDRQRSVDLGGFSLLAKTAQRVQPPAGSSATDVLFLTKVAALERTNDGFPSTEVTAERAWIMLFPFAGAGDLSASEQEQSRVVMRLENVVGSREGAGGGGARKSLDLARPIASGFRDNVKFLSYRDLKLIKENPQRINWVDSWRKELAFNLAEREYSLDLRKQVTANAGFTLLDENNNPVRINAGRMSASATVPRGFVLAPAQESDNISITFQKPGEADAAPVTLTGKEALLTIDLGKDQLDRALHVHIDVQNIILTHGATASERASYRLAGLSPATGDPVAPILTLPIAQLDSRAADVIARGEATAELSSTLDSLRKGVQRVTRQALAKQHERLAMAAACLVLTFTGAVMALRLSRKLPLTAYIFTFVPAVICIVAMASGQQLVLQQGAIGLWVMWSGVAGVFVYAMVQFRGLAAH